MTHLQLVGRLQTLRPVLTPTLTYDVSLAEWKQWEKSDFYVRFYVGMDLTPFYHDIGHVLTAFYESTESWNIDIIVALYNKHIFNTFC